MPLSRVASVPRALVRRLLERGMSTSDYVDSAVLGYEETDLYHYEPSSWLSLPLALPRRHTRRDDVLADVGCGKGRVVVQAARRYKIKRVIGVELSAELHAVARRNVESTRSRLRTRDVQLSNADVLEWVVPEDLTIVYMHNPFAGEVFSRFIHRLIAFVDERERPLRLLYVNPVEHDRLIATGRVVEGPPPRGPLTRVARMKPGMIRRYEIQPRTQP